MPGSVTTRPVVTLPGMRGSSYALRVSYQGPAQSSEEAVLARRITDAAPARDIAAETALYRSLVPRVRLYGLKHLRDVHAAADLVQDVLLMTFERLRRGELRELERIASFVLGACRQTVVDQRRGQQRRQHLLDVYAGDLPMADATSSPALDTLTRSTIAARARSANVDRSIPHARHATSRSVWRPGPR